MKITLPKFEKIRVNSLFYKLSAVFLSFFVVPVIVSSIIFYNYSTNVVENEVNNANHSLLKHASELTDVKILEIRRTIFELWGKPIIRKLSNPVINVEEYVSLLSQSIDTIQNIKNNNDFIEGIFIYFIDSDTFISNYGKMDYTTYFNRICSYEGIPASRWKVNFRKINSFNIMSTTKVTSYSIDKKVENTRNLITILSTVPFDEKPKAAIGIQIEESKINEILRGIQLTKDGSVYILGNDGSVISHTMGYDNYISEQKKNINQLSMNGTGSYISWQNGKNMNSFITSSRTGWKYIAEIPYSEISERFFVIKLVTFIVCVFFILAGAIISIKVSSVVYNPVKDLVDRFLKNAETPEEIAKKGRLYDFKVLKSGMENILSHNRKLRHILESNMEGLQQKIMFDLINGRHDSIDIIKLKAEEFGITFDYKYYAVALLKFEFFKQAYMQFSSESIEDIKSGFFDIIRAITGSKNLIAYTFESGKNDYISIINIDSDDINIIKEAFNEIISLFNYDDNLVRFSIAISSISSDMLKIPDLFSEASKAMNHRIMDHKSQILDMQSAAENSDYSKLYYPFAIEESIYNLMLAGNDVKAVEILNDVINKNMENNLSYEYWKEIITALKNTLVKVATGKNLILKEVLGNEIDIYEGLANFSEIEEIRKFFTDAYQTTGQYIRNSKKSTNEKLLKGILDYLEENYQNEVYLEAVSERVNSTPKYISRFFKEQTGVNFVDYVNKMKIAKAKELLLENDSKVQEISSMVGFDNVNSFIRVFKKYEGISPGQYKDMCR